MEKQKDKVTTFKANNRLKVGFFETFVIMGKNVVKSKTLIWQLFKRDFLGAYKKSFLGFSWVLVSPILGIASWIFLNAAGVLKPGTTSIPFPLFILLSSSLWGLFMGFYSSAAGTLGAGSGFIMQVKYPHEALLVKQIAQHLVNFSIGFTLNIIILIVFGSAPNINIVFFPLLILPMFFLACAMGLIISVVNIVATDLTNIFNILLGLVFYITPIVYAQDSITSDLLSKVIKLNPLTYLIGGVRDVILTGQMQHFDRYIIAAVISFIFFLVALRLFYVSEDKVVEKMI